ncbi:hypothetical protein M972_111161 [Acetivibrio thermocellus AD2]|jgi:hypothetical protein|uniref:Type IV pilus assembly protein PilO n=1 Tax=Acetivibrio thermocellus AD2 TaxID=1138384 RepID=A0AB36TFS3_ACETH|nr:hypothetical protein [Acetivibrio thermocellus]ADU74176.1 hypothetical protein Clo1313_1112 [Acetivibrio thermocellus DSM 1313]ALX08119.1 hypothetical protein AD2_01124 [Acetivibrio thermocellus AD2]ANV75866.1 hypothetical protein LQRI_1125 [Acetivibrio thermocellus DSM 2360]EIC05869.1 hypothetical protein YSBL_0442 [Acetivibrio thermocellus YS]PFH02390.1 hypothetical protein M972_111161 [Acetivibrio thermocellus AD2]
MGKDKGKIALLIVLLLVLYGVIYYQFIWTPKFSLDIEDINSKIETAQKQKQKLDNDLANIETLKRNLEMKTVQNERLETYLLNDSNVSDGFEYIEKLGKLFKNKLYNVKVKRPAEKKIGNSKDDKNAQSYYEIQIDFDATMTYREIMELVDYLEGGTRKVKITKFEVSPLGNKQANATPTPQNTAEPQTESDEQNAQNALAKAIFDPNEVLDLGMTVCMYSMNRENADKIYDFSRQNFQRYFEGDQVFFDDTGVALNSGEDSENISAGGSGGASGGSSGSGTDTVAVTGNAKPFGGDLGIYMQSFLTGGQNFYTYDNTTNKTINFRTKITPKVTMTFNGDTVDINVVGNAGNTYDMTGHVPKDTVEMHIVLNYNLTPIENKDLGVNVQIINNTDKQININLYDKVRRAKITDRNGNSIYKSSSVEKVTIV